MNSAIPSDIALPGTPSGHHGERTDRDAGHCRTNTRGTVAANSASDIARRRRARFAGILMLLAISTAQHTHRVFPDQLASKHDRDTSSPTTPSERWLELLRLHNTARRVREKQPLRLNEKLGRAAQRFAECMARIKKYDHDADGRSPAERIEAEGYLWSSYSENIGWSIRSDREAFDTWMNSASHRENIFGRETEVGFGSAQGVYVAVYASPR